MLVLKQGEPDRRDAFWARMLLGDLEQARGHLAPALVLNQEARAVAERLARADQGNTGWHRDLAVSHWKLAIFGKSTGDLAQAREHPAEGRTIMADLVARFPDWEEWKRNLASYDAQLAALEQKQKDPGR